MKNDKHYSLVAPLSVVAVSALAAAVTFLLPIPPDVTNPVATHLRAAIATAPTFLYVGAALIFLRGLKSFKAEMRSAYRLIAFGMLAFSALLAQLVYWGLSDTWDSAWATSGSGMVPFVVASALTYVGARKFARLIKVKSFLNSFWLTFGITLAASIGMGILAYLFVAYELEGTELYIAIVSWGAIYLTCATVLIYKISRSIGAYYQNAMKWLVVGAACFAAASWHESINTFWFNNGSTYTDYGYYLLPWIVSGVVLVFASYKFRNLTIFGSAGIEKGSSVTDSDYIDSVVSVAGLASRPNEIDNILEDVRLVTSGIKPGDSLTEADKQQLIKTYGQLEAYLREKDPLRTFTKEELLSYTTPAFRSVVAQTK